MSRTRTKTGTRVLPTYVDPPRPLDAPPAASRRAVAAPERYDPGDFTTNWARAMRSYEASRSSSSSSSSSAWASSSSSSSSSHVAASDKMIAVLDILASSNYCDDGADSAVVQRVAAEHGVTTRTVTNWLGSALLDGTTERAERSTPRARPAFDVANEVLHDIYDGLDVHNYSVRTFWELVNRELGEREDLPLDRVSLVTVQSVLSSDYWSELREYVRPTLTEEHRRRRVEWARERLADKRSDVLRVHVDEKVFLQYQVRRTIYVPSFLAKSFQSTQRPSKNKIPGVSFVAFVCEPVIDSSGKCLFDGKLAWECQCTWTKATDNRGYHKKGVEYPKFDEQMTAKLFKTKYLGRVLLNALASVLPLLPSIRAVEVLIDGAGAHGVGNSKDHGASREREFTSYLNSEWRQRVDVPMGHHHTQFSVRVQPAKSPDVNLLDIAVWRSLSTNFEVLTSSEPTKTMSHRMIDEFKAHWDAMDGLRVLGGATRALMSTLTAIIEFDGGNNFRVPHSGAKRTSSEGSRFLPPTKKPKDEASRSWNSPAVVDKRRRDGVAGARSVSNESATPSRSTPSHDATWVDTARAWLPSWLSLPRFR